MQIDRLIAKNFQCLEEIDLELGPFTVLLGLNESGKSSVGEAILYALTGQATRGDTLGDLVRHGSKAMSVEVVAGDVAVMRDRTRSGGTERFLDGVGVSDEQLAAGLRERLGIRTEAIAAALRAGALLEMRPAELLKLLADLTGARFGKEDIHTALGAAVAAAAKRSGLSLPAALGDFAAAAKRAEGARQEAKRQLTARQADLDHAPAPSAEAAALAASVTVEDLRAELERLRERHAGALADRAEAQGRDAGAREERERSLRARLEELAAVERPAVVPGTGAGVTQAAIADADREAGRLEGLLAVAEPALEAALKAAPKTRPKRDDPNPAHAIRDQIAENEAALAPLRAGIAAAKADGERLAAEVKAAKEGACELGCKSHCPAPRDIAALEAKLEAARKRYAAALKDSNRLTEAGMKLSRALDVAQLAEAFDAAIEAGAKAKKLKAALTDARDRAAALRQSAGELSAGVAAAAAYSRAQDEIRGLEKQLAALDVDGPPAPASPDEDPAVLVADIARTEAALAAARLLETRKGLQAAVAAAEHAVSDADLVAQACGPKGARMKLLGRAIGLFLEAANAALARFGTGYEVGFETEDEPELVVRRGSSVFRPGQLSSGARQRLLYVLQIAVARLSGVSVVVLDCVELLDDAGRTAAKRLAAECSREGVQAILLTSAAAPAAVPASVTAYVLSDGRASRIPTAQPQPKPETNGVEARP